MKAPIIAAIDAIDEEYRSTLLLKKAHDAVANRLRTRPMMFQVVRSITE